MRIDNMVISWFLSRKGDQIMRFFILFLSLVTVNFQTVFANQNWACVQLNEIVVDEAGPRGKNLNKPFILEWASNNKVKIDYLTYERVNKNWFINDYGSLYIYKSKSYGSPNIVAITENVEMGGGFSRMELKYFNCND